MAGEGDFEDVGVLPTEDQLRYISRHIKQLLASTQAGDVIINNLLISFHNVLRTTSATGLDARLQVAAWNALCALIDQCAAPPDPSISRIFWERNFWTRAFDVYIDQARYTRPKSSRQVCVTLAAALSKAPLKQADQLRLYCSRRQVEPLVSGKDHSQVKACASSLAHFLAKDVLSLDDILQQLHPSVYEPEIPQSTRLDRLLSILFRWLGAADFGSTIGHLVSVVLDHYAKRTTAQSTEIVQDVLPVWVGALHKASLSNAMESANLRAHLLPVLFKRSLPDYAAFLWEIGLDRIDNHRVLVGEHLSTTRLTTDNLLYASLQTGKELGLLLDTEEHNASVSGDAVYLPISGIAHLLSQNSRLARLTGLSLLVTSFTLTRPLLPMACRVLQQHLHHFFADTDANFRGEVCSLVQRLMDRIRAVTAVLARQAKRTDSRSEYAQVLNYHKDFLEWLIRFLRWELRPTASYQRHISALKCLSIVMRSGLENQVQPQYLSKSAVGETKWPFHLSVVTMDLRHILLDLLSDPFDDVRQLAAEVLGRAPLNTDAAFVNGYTTDINLTLKRAELAMLATGRADQADGVAHIYSLLSRSPDSIHNVMAYLVDQLEEMLQIAEADIMKAVEKYPVHGLLTSVRYVFRHVDVDFFTDNRYRERLVICLHSVWNIVKTVLCDDAPEGYLPEGFEDQINASTKNTLSYCWRALKEASLLLGTLVSVKKSSSHQPEYLTEYDDLLSLCNLCFTQLAELRHRGAFSTVAQTWAICCVQVRQSHLASSVSMLEVWYNDVLLILRSKTTINTRRSAGLPSLLCGILVADDTGGLTKHALRDLEAIARETVNPTSVQEGSLPQVHAMNCIKDIFKNARLGEKSERYIATALKLAADALHSEAWAIRNCGLMLFRAVIDRLLGTSDSDLDGDINMQKRLSTSQHAGLLETVLDLLSVPQATPAGLSTGHEGVFLALQLLQHLHVPDQWLAKVRWSVFALMSSPPWHVRDKAARTYASFVEHDQTLPEMCRLLQTDPGSQNMLHGAILCAKFIVVRFAARAERDRHHGVASSSHSDFRLALDLMRSVSGASSLYWENPCPITRAAYLDVLRECLSLSMVQEICFIHASASVAQQALHYDTVWTLNQISFSTELERLCDGTPVEIHFNAILIMALTLAMACELSSKNLCGTTEPSSLPGLIVKLAVSDEAACVEFLRSLNVSHLIRNRSLHDNLDTVISSCTILLDVGSSAIKVACEAQRTLLNIVRQLQCDNVKSEVFQKFAKSRVLMEPGSRNTNQHHADLRLQFDAACMDYRAEQVNELDIGLSNDVHTWTSYCIEAVETSNVYSREAAALALGNLTWLWKVLASNRTVSSSFQSLCLAVYDLLNDDEEEIRLLASQAACRIIATDVLSIASVDMVPFVAAQKLVGFILKKWRASPETVEVAFSRAFRLNQHTSSTVSERFKDCAEDSTALFAEEKQNLYIDDAMQTILWAQVAMRVPHETIPKTLIDRLARWTTEGLQVLMTKLSPGEHDVPGWTANADIFTLGLSVIYGAELLLDLVKRGRMIPIPPSTLKKQLWEIATIKAVGSAHVLWVRKIEQLLARSVGERLRLVKRLMDDSFRQARLHNTLHE